MRSDWTERFEDPANNLSAPALQAPGLQGLLADAMNDEPHLYDQGAAQATAPSHFDDHGATSGVATIVQPEPYNQGMAHTAATTSRLSYYNSTLMDASDPASSSYISEVADGFGYNHGYPNASTSGTSFGQEVPHQTTLSENTADYYYDDPWKNHSAH